MSYELPPIAQEIEDLIGRDGLRALCHSAGGVPLYIPARHLDRHPLAALIGLDNLRALSESYGGTKVMLPKLTAERRRERDLEIMRLRLTGQSARQTALKFGLCHRAAQRAFARIRRAESCPDKPKPRQRSLW